MLGVVEPGNLNGIGAPEWQEVEFTVDSGASETVMNMDTLPMIQAEEGAASKRGVEYEVADGTRIRNEGEKTFDAHTEGGAVRRITAQVCAVNKALLSVRKVVAAGNRVVFSPNEAYIEDLATGERMEMEEANGMYVLKAWVKNEGF